MTNVPHARSYNDSPVRSIYWITVVLLALLGIYAAIHRMTYVTDAIVFIVIATLFFLFRKDTIFSWEGVLLCCVGMLMNTAGALGAYDFALHGIGWDKFLHIVSTAGIGILVYAYLHHLSQRSERPAIGPLTLALLTFFVVIGLGALNEITEFFGAIYFGFSQGILGMTNGSIVSNNGLERFDTQWDLVANSMGALVAVVYMTIKTSLVKKTDVRRANGKA